MGLERRLGVHWVRMVDITLGRNEDQFGLGTGITPQTRYHNEEKRSCTSKAMIAPIAFSLEQT